MIPSTLAVHRVRLARVTTQLREHLDEPLEFAALARVAGLSPRQFERVFLRVMGESVRAYVRRLRLERAAERLRATSTPILTLAFDAGFESHEAFTRSFRQRFGRAPAAYRNSPNASVEPRDREKFWELVAAGGLRRHVER